MKIMSEENSNCRFEFTSTHKSIKIKQTVQYYDVQLAYN